VTHSTKLIWITPNAEEVIAYCARVSNPSNQSNHETAPRLLQYCVKHGHWSVFETVNMCVEINTTRSIAAQILRHRSFSFQEFSQRYAPVTTTATTPLLRRQDIKNRQNSIDDLTPEVKEYFESRIGYLFDDAYAVYEEMLEMGVAKECARDVLPLATPTKLYMNGTIRSWIHYCQLRCGNGTQQEHRMIAEGAYKLLQEHLPSVCTALTCVNTH
jgi:thymidylate synthase (FAD)